MGNHVKALSVKDLPPGRMITVHVEKKGILFANLDGKIYAVSSSCTHEEADLSEGTLIGHNVVCPFHQSEFDLRTGEVLNRPAEHPLRTYSVSIEDEGIFVEV